MTLLVGIPTYDDKLMSGLATLLMSEHQPGYPDYRVFCVSRSLLAMAHNELLCVGLNNRPEITHLLIVHSDVLPARGFIGQMLNDMVEHQADVLGALIPIKDEKGVTSTALLPHVGEPEGDVQGRQAFMRRRLTLKEAVNLPDVFDVKDLQALFCDTSPDAALLVNTGLLLIDLRCPAIEHVHFEINDAIFKTDKGEFYTDVEPEDWYFSRQLAEQGARVMVTRRVGLRHMGRAPFPNQGLWGSWETDQAAQPAAQQ